MGAVSMISSHKLKAGYCTQQCGQDVVLMKFELICIEYDFIFSQLEMHDLTL